jgi:hypothetical protein
LVVSNVENLGRAVRQSIDQMHRRFVASATALGNWPCERREVGVGDLTVSDDAGKVGLVVGEVVGPEDVSRVVGHRRQQ